MRDLLHATRHQQVSLLRVDGPAIDRRPDTLEGSAQWPRVAPSILSTEVLIRRQDALAAASCESRSRSRGEEGYPNR
jgi:hypothetical protein